MELEEIKRLSHLRTSAVSYLVTVAISGVLPFYLGAVATHNGWGVGEVGARWLMLALPMVLTLASSWELAEGLERSLDRIKVALVPLCTFLALGLEASFPSTVLASVGTILLAMAPCWLIEVYRAEAFQLGYSQSCRYFLMHHLFTLVLALYCLLELHPGFLLLMIPGYWMATMVVLGHFALELPSYRSNG